MIVETGAKYNFDGSVNKPIAMHEKDASVEPQGGPPMPLKLVGVAEPSLRASRERILESSAVECRASTRMAAENVELRSKLMATGHLAADELKKRDRDKIVAEAERYGRVRGW
jgi:hypothetical protein